MHSCVFFLPLLAALPEMEGQGLGECLRGSPTLFLCCNPSRKSHAPCVQQIGQVLEVPLS